MRFIILYLILFFSFINVDAQTDSRDDFVNTQIQQLNVALKHYTAINKSEAWKTVPISQNSTHNITSQSEIKNALRNNLCLTGDLPEDVITISPADEDSAIFYALKYFQFRHGLQETGQLNNETLKAINTPICDWIEKIRINIKRWEDFLIEGENLYLLVNIPDFTLVVLKDGKPDLKMKVIVGKTSTPTARFYGEIEQIIINPSWVVPTSIVRNELFEKIKSNPTYLAKNHYKLYSRGSHGKREVSWEEIDWSVLNSFHFNYSLEQTPGVWNALGKVKFLFPNNHDIYLHDTPEKGLFKNRIRAYSHGCVRVEKPVELAKYLLNERTNISNDFLKKYLSKTETKGLLLDYSVPVALAYFTGFIDENHVLHFREDIYNLDVIEPEEWDIEIGKL